MAIIRPGAWVPDKIPYMVEFNITIKTYRVPDTFPHMAEFNAAMHLVQLAHLDPLLSLLKQSVKIIIYEIY